MKSYSTLLVLLFTCLALAAGRTAHGQNQYEQQVLQQLRDASFVFTDMGYTPVISGGGNLEQGSSETYDVPVQAGATYAIVGVCDQDCGDLDLALYDPYGNLVSYDQTDDDAPVVEVTATSGGTFTLQVTMFQCSDNPCYYGVGLYGAAAAPTYDDTNVYEQQVIRQLQEASYAFTSAGYTPIIADGGGLAPGEIMTFNVPLQAGASYMLMGVCDEDCLDLDLALYDGYNNLISQDATEDDAPVVDVTVTTGGNFTLQVTMYDCRADLCYYGVGLYGQ